MECNVFERKEFFERIEEISPFPAIVYSKGEIAYCNNLFYEEIGISEIKLALNGDIETLRDYIKSNHELTITTIKGIKKQYEIKSKMIDLDGLQIIVSYFIDISEKYENEKQLKRVVKLHNLILDVTQQVSHLEKPQEIYEIILDNTFRALEKATVGTVLLLEGDNLIVAAYRGFPDSIKTFVLPLSESFLYQETNGLLNRTSYIQNLNGLKGYLAIKMPDGNEKLIMSTISTPIWIEEKFFGMINIDSEELDAFDEIDKNTMEFLKCNIEFALTNQLLYIEKASLAKLDSLTELFNRRSFEEFSCKAIARAKRYAEEFCVVLFDIDGLKSINDEHGHLMGDKAIKAVANIISDCTRKSDVLARIGGDEFVGIYFKTTKKQLAIKFEALSKNKIIIEDTNGNSEFMCSFSYGIASYPIDGNTKDELIRKSDIEMYKMKKRTGFYV